MSDQETVQQQPEVSPEDHAKLNEVGQAGAAAAAEGKDVKAAMKGKRDEVGLKMSDEDIEKVADTLFGKFADLMRESGMMDPPLEAVRPPQEPSPPPAPPSPTSAEQVPAPEAPTPRKRTPAQRFFGVD